jgi:hypothetical protein
LLQLQQKRSYELVIPIESNLDEVFELQKFQLRSASIDGVYPSQPFFENSYIL